jgi:hypothetical protein
MTWDVGPTLRQLDKQPKGQKVNLEHPKCNGPTESTGNRDGPQRMDLGANLPHRGGEQGAPAKEISYTR